MFIENVCKYDIVCFAETMLRESPGNLPGFTSPYIVKPIKAKKRGRPSGGMLIFIKAKFKNVISEIKQNNFSIWLKIDGTFLNLEKNIFLCFTYIKPYINKDISELTFTKLENDISFFLSKGEVILSGDFNARTGGLNDFIQNDGVNDNFTDCPVPEDYTPDLPLERNQLDQKNNLHGNLLVNICKSSQMRIVNGRFLGDSLGYFTFYNSNGKSTVDYMLTSQNLFYTINNFMVKPPTDLSDHCLIALNIFNFKNSKEIDKEELWSLPGTFKWADQSKDIYIDALLEEKSVEHILSLNKLIDDNNFNDIDFLVTKTNEIYLEAAKKSVSFKANFKKSKMQRHTKKAKPKKVWMSNDCLLLRKVRSLGNKLGKAPTGNYD